MRQRLIPGLAVTALLLLAGCASSTEDAMPDGSSVDATPGSGSDSDGDLGTDAGTAWSFTDTEGATHSRESAAASPTVLFFFATWCTKCRQTAPKLATVHAEFVDQGLDTFSLTWDPQEDEDDIATWKLTYGQDWPHGVDPGLETQKSFRVTRQSTIIVLDGNGSEVDRFSYDTPSESELRDAIQAAFDA